MAEMDTSGGGHHKKGPGVKKVKKAVYPCGSYPDGGSWLSAHHLLHLHHNHDAAYGNEAVPAQGYGKAGRAEQGQGVSSAYLFSSGRTMQCIIMKAPCCRTASNFKTTNFKDIRKVIIDKKKIHKS